MRNISIRARLAIWYTFTIALFLCLTFGIVYVAMERTLKQQYMDNIVRDSIIIADEVDSDDGVIGFDLDDEEEEMLATGTLYSIYTKDNKWFYGERSDWIYNIEIAYDKIRQIEHNGEEWLVYDSEAYDDGRLAGWVRVLLPLKDMHAFLEDLLLIGLIITPLGMLLAAIGGAVIAGRALKPVATITQTAQQMGAGDLSTRIMHVGANDEIGKLSVAFNEMADNLEAAFEREKRFTSDASHEMRTPLAVIITYAEDALKRRQLDRFEDATAIILDKSRQMQALLNQLLSLARGYEQVLHMEKVDLASIIADIAEEMREQAGRSGIIIRLDLTPNIIINADILTITRMLMNLLSNGIKYGNENGLISISTAIAAQNVMITVCDDGIGIADEDIPHIFERFYRGDKSRTGNNGAGLGLSFVEMAVKLHGGSISVESAIGKGSKFTILLPRTQLAI